MPEAEQEWFQVTCIDFRLDAVTTNTKDDISELILCGG